MTRSLELPYQPNIVPTDPAELPRWLDVELNKISLALVAQPVSMAITEDNLLAIGPTPNWQVMFIGTNPVWEVPGGEFDSTTGRWTCPQGRLYSMNVQMEVAAFGSGNKNYYAGVAIVRDRGGVLTRWESTDGGDDNIPLGVTLSGLQGSEQGDIWHVEATAVHENQTGTVDISIAWQILRAA